MARRADLILVSFPLYIDSLPFLLMKAFEVLSEPLAAAAGDRPGEPAAMAAIANNGFPEAHHNSVAVAICRRFAERSGLVWRGGLALGGGEALFRGQPFEKTKGRNGPPVSHVQRGLDLAAKALADERPIPEEAMRMITKTPIPLVPFGLWRRLFYWWGEKHWKTRAGKNDVDPEAMNACPYARQPESEVA